MQAEHFRALLLALDAEEQNAAQQYHSLHRRLVRLFALNRVADPHALADEAMDRLARRIVEQPGGIESPTAFLLGIARHLLREEERRRIRERDTANEWALHMQAKEPSNEALLESVDECLSRMKPDQQALLRAYYQDSGREKIEHHRQLAAERGLTVNALRNRLMRARRELDDCVHKRFSDVSGEGNTKR